MEHYEEHVELAKEIFRKYELPYDLSKFEDYLSPPVLHHFGPQVVVVQEFNGGPGEVDTVSIVGFYIPHDGQCTVAVNHMDGCVTLDNANLMFGKKEF